MFTFTACHHSGLHLQGACTRNASERDVMDAVKGGNPGPFPLDNSSFPHDAFDIMKFQVDHALLALVVCHVAFQQHADTFHDIAIHHLQTDNVITNMLPIL